MVHHDDLGGGWDVSLRRAARALVADALAVLALAAILALFWWFGGVSV